MANRNRGRLPRAIGVVRVKREVLFIYRMYAPPSVFIKLHSFQNDKQLQQL